MNHLYHLLEHYFSQPKEDYWSVATLVTKSGSSYRNSGAMMLISPEGRTFGLISGGCLESDIARRAQRVWQLGKSDFVIYDTEDDESFVSKLELGCNGTIGVIIQAIRQQHHELLTILQQRMKHKQVSYLLQCFKSAVEEDTQHWALLDESANVINTTKTSLTVEFNSDITILPAKQSVEIMGQQHWSISKIDAPINLWVLGGGVDAMPIVELAATMGWIVTVVDHRVTHGRKSHFTKANTVHNLIPEEAVKEAEFLLADAVICMTHNKSIDARWMQKLSEHEHLAYIALIGPESRKQEVMKLSSTTDSFCEKVYGPAGIAEIKGDLPEAIALSIIAECHQVLANRYYE